MSGQLPGSVVNSLRALTLMVAVTGVITVLIWLLRDDIIMAWSKGNPTAQEILATGGIEALRDNQIVPGFLAISIVAFVGFALLALVLGALLVGGHGWARLGLTATAGTGALVAGICLDNQLPTVFVVLSAVVLLLGLVLLFFLWQRETTRYLREV